MLIFIMWAAMIRAAWETAYGRQGDDASREQNPRD